MKLKDTKRTFYRGLKQLLIVAVILRNSTVISQGGNYEWVNKIGGTGNDVGHLIHLDDFGNIYTIGTFNDAVDFDPGTGINTLNSNGNADVFILKTNASGNLIWAKIIGDGNWDEIYSIDSDNAGNIYLTGAFLGTVDFDPGTGINSITSNGSADVFILKLSSSGDFIWAKSAGGSDLDKGLSIAVEGSGQLYVTGYFAGMVDFDSGSAISTLTSNGSSDIFILKLTENGDFLWAQNFGDSNVDKGRAIRVDNSGNIYITGEYKGTVDFDAGASVEDLISNGNSDIFVLKLSAGGGFDWVKSLGGQDNDIGYSLEIDVSGSIYSTGWFNGTADFDPGTAVSDLISNGSDDIFVSKLDNSGNFVWANSFGGTDTDKAISVTVDPSGNTFVTGYFMDTISFDLGVGISDLISNGQEDIFVFKIYNNGNIDWAESFGGSGTDKGRSISADDFGKINMTGEFEDTIDFGPGTLINNLESNGNTDVFFLEMTDESYLEVKEARVGHEVSIFPNPVKFQLFIDIDENIKTVKVMDLRGGTVEIIRPINNTIDFLNYSSGAYFLQIETPSFTVVKKLIVE